MINIFRKKRPKEDMVWGWNEPVEKETAQVPSAPGPAASEPQVQDDFLGALASAASSESPNQEQTTYTNDYSLSEKIERLGRRMDSLFERIDLMEHKVSRIERRNSEY